MKKTQLKEILRPLIKECIREAIFEEGVLSGIITEVARGMSHNPTTAPEPEPNPSDLMNERLKRNAFSKEQSGKLKEHKKKLMSAIGGSAYNGVDLFEGTSPARSSASSSDQASPLTGEDAADPGVDISNLLGAVGHNWNAHMNDVK